MISDELNRIIKAKSDLKDFLQKMGIDAEDAKVSDLATIFSVLIDNALIFPTGTELPVFNLGMFGSPPVRYVHLPEGITQIGNDAFSTCPSISFINLPKSIKSIGNQSFYGMKLPLEIDLPNLERLSINAFGGNGNVTKIINLGKITALNTVTFMNCSHLTIINLPASLTKIDAAACLGCTALIWVKCLAAVPPALGSDVFTNTNNCPIYVPDASVSAYQASTNWIAYASRIKPLSTFVE